MLIAMVLLITPGEIDVEVNLEPVDIRNPTGLMKFPDEQPC